MESTVDPCSQQILYLSISRDGQARDLAGELVSIAHPTPGTHLCGYETPSLMGRRTSHLQSSPGTGLSFWQGHLSLLNTSQWPLESGSQGFSEMDQKLTTQLGEQWGFCSQLRRLL